MSVPVWIMEPISSLQKMAEIMEYTSLLDRANAEPDEYQRLALVCAFALSPYAANNRTWKPFNPVLGETFELHVDGEDGVGGKGVRYIAEQVSHHPPIAVAHGENASWTYDITAGTKTTFLGNSIEINCVGRTRILLRSTGEVYTILPPISKVQNLFVGGAWIDNYGELIVKNRTTGSTATLVLEPCGWFGANRYECNGEVTDADGRPRLLLAGKCNEDLAMIPCSEEGEPVEDESAEKSLWRAVTERPEGDYYGFTYFALRMNDPLKDNESKKLVRPLPSDCRRREDRALLQGSESSKAGTAKNAIEQQQREERAIRERKGDAWQTRWFSALQGDAGGEAKMYAPYDDEAGLEELPGFAFKGEMPALVESDEEQIGTGFNPWQYPGESAP